MPSTHDWASPWRINTSRVMPSTVEAHPPRSNACSLVTDVPSVRVVPRRPARPEPDPQGHHLGPVALVQGERHRLAGTLALEVDEGEDGAVRPGGVDGLGRAAPRHEDHPVAVDGEQH